MTCEIDFVKQTTLGILRHLLEYILRTNTLISFNIACEMQLFAFWKALFSVIQGNMNFDFFQMIFMIGLFFKTFQNQFKESCFRLFLF